MQQHSAPAGEWIKAVPTHDRDLDVIDEELALMAQTIRKMVSESVLFTLATYSVLTTEYRECAKLNRELTPDQRAEAVKALASATPEGALKAILHNAADQ